MAATPSAKDARLGLVLTGGTVGSNDVDGILVVDLTSTSSEREAQLVRRSWTGPQRLNVITRTPIRKFSEDFLPVDWVNLANCVRELVEVDEVSSVLILHGTDTMGFTAAALSFMLADLDATIVLTGANLPLDDASSDGPTNIRDALLASHAMPRGVYVSFAGTLGASSEVHAGTTVRKVQANGRAYVSPNYGPVAHVSMGSVKLARPINNELMPRRPAAVSRDVHAMTLFPGIDFDMISSGLIASGKKGVVVRMYPGISAPEHDSRDSFSNFVHKCVDAGIFVATCVERCVDATVEYPSNDAARRAGAVFAREMIYETAYVKLSWALAQTTSRAELEDLFLKPIAGETTATSPAIVTA